MTCIYKLILKCFICIRVVYYYLSVWLLCQFIELILLIKKKNSRKNKTLCDIYTGKQKFSNPAYLTILVVILQHQSIERTRQLLAYKIVHVLCNLWAHQSSSFTSCRKFLSLFVQVNSLIN